MCIRDSIYTLIAFLAVSVCTSCQKDTEIPGGPISAYNQVYLPAAVNFPAVLSDVKNPKVLSIVKPDSVYTLVYGAYFGGYDYAGQDIQVQFSVKPALADTFNATNGTAFSLLPENSYSLSQTSAVIPKGKLSTDPQSISISPAGKLASSKTYILPVSISGIDQGIRVNEKLRTAYFLVKVK
jgi:hypothetical protein